MTSKAARMHEFHFGRHDGERDEAGHHGEAGRDDGPASGNVSRRSLVSGRGRWLVAALGLATLVGAAVALKASQAPALLERTRALEVTDRWQVDPTVSRAHATQALQALSAERAPERAALTPSTTTAVSEPTASDVPAAPGVTSKEPRSSSTLTKGDNPYSSTNSSHGSNDNPY